MGKVDTSVSYIDKIGMCLRHAQKLVLLKGENIAIREMRGLAPHYISGLYNSSIIKNKMSKLESYNELEELLENYKKELDEVNL